MRHARHHHGWTLLCLLALACGQSEPPAQAQSEQPTEQPAANKADQAIEAASSAYESIRAKLASDRIGAITPDAAALHKAASEAQTQAKPELRKSLGSLAEAAKGLQEMPKKDGDAVRRAFGEVSRHLVTLLGAEPELRKGRHLFQCPMAQDYGQWVQPNEELENPYMGKRMLKCGSAKEW